MHKIEPGTIILVRRQHASYTSSSLLMVTAADETDEQCLNNIQVQVMPTSAVTTELRDHLVQFEDADDVSKSHHVLQSLVTTALRNGPPAPLSQYVAVEDWVFPNPSGGTLRKYLLGDKCPNPSCQDGYCMGREQVYQAYPFLQAGLRPDVLHWCLSEVHDSPMLCLACYGFKTVRSNERIAIAALMINTGRQQPTITVAQRIDNHRSYLARVLRPALGHNTFEHFRYRLQYSAEADVLRPSDASISSTDMSHTHGNQRPTPEVLAATGLARDSSGYLKYLNPTLKGGEGNPAHPGRRSTQQQLESISGSGQRRSTRTSARSMQQATNLTPAQLAGRAARARYDRLRAQQVAESQATYSASVVNPTAGPSRNASSSASRPGSSRTRSSVHRPPRAEVGRSRSSAQPAPFVYQEASSPRLSVAERSVPRASVAEPSIPRTTLHPPTQPPVTQPLPIIPETPQPPIPPLTLRSSSPGWQEIPPSLQQQWQATPAWQPIPPTLQQQWQATPTWQPIPPTLQQQWNNESDWQPIPPDMVEEMQKGNPTYPARQQAIQDMAKSRFKNWIKRNRKKGDGKCPVCLCLLGDNGDETYILTTLCGHDFHEECVLEWFKTNDGCPMCRMKQE
ncbi:hypothetical protein CKM354_001250800 [Cercospora kikuchii]|uniref:RING-type domain-containing protein n=1 Tax=Cercospora kikuchii TaxID=84275 RepID=A0A9P3FM45_9PEZI|nr:uncharacterized protein CKM354_001250800 [Cercospora kikuchii]GIZ49478.1 hypothetical protein CKM354_001250800 [Cercospora kikuchii]